MTNKPVMGDQTPLTKRAVDEAWEKLPTSDHRLGYMISFAQLLEEKLARLTQPEEERAEQAYLERLKRLHNWLIITRPYVFEEFAASGFYDALPAASNEEQR